jgi:hypothetical protein
MMNKLMIEMVRKTYSEWYDAHENEADDMDKLINDYCHAYTKTYEAYKELREAVIDIFY